jgi:hypothetical protein
MVALTTAFSSLTDGKTPVTAEAFCELCHQIRTMPIFVKITWLNVMYRYCSHTGVYVGAKKVILEPPNKE